MAQWDDFHTQVRRVCALVEKTLIAWIVCALLVTVAAQTLYQSDSVRRGLVLTERLEGLPVQP